MGMFSMSSLNKLATCHEDLQVLFNHVVKNFDCMIAVGHRGEAEQNQDVAEGKSKTPWPTSKHNSSPSMAVDVYPYPLPEWKNSNDFIFFGGYVLGVADLLYEQGLMRHKVRYGGDWNMNERVSDSTFFDLGHFELYVPKDVE